MQDWVCARSDDERLIDSGEAGGRDSKSVNANRGLRQLELTFVACFGVKDKGGIAGLEVDFSAGDRAVLLIVNDTVDVGEDGGTSLYG
jgi:hypothetical protein